MCMPSRDGRKEGIIMAIEKFCTRCGKKFLAVGREVICPACKEQAAAESKKAAVLKAKRASWSGESVPVRISGRASTVIRRYGKASNLPFAAALDELLKASSFFQTMGKAWEDVEPYCSHRRDKATSTTETAQEVKQDATQEVKQAAKVANKTSASKAAGKAASKTKTSKGGKAC